MSQEQTAPFLLPGRSRWMKAKLDAKQRLRRWAAHQGVSVLRDQIALHHLEHRSIAQRCAVAELDWVALPRRRLSDRPTGQVRQPH
eukprot:COSAG04_NODE_2322_length_4333_cov_7.621871_1_plen_86_part_00